MKYQVNSENKTILILSGDEMKLFCDQINEIKEQYKDYKIIVPKKNKE